MVTIFTRQEHSGAGVVEGHVQLLVDVEFPLPVCDQAFFAGSAVLTTFFLFGKLRRLQHARFFWRDERSPLGASGVSEALGRFLRWHSACGHVVEQATDVPHDGLFLLSLATLPPWRRGSSRRRR